MNASRDNDNFRRVLQRRLAQKSNFAVYGFATAEDALNASLTIDCHAVLLDMMLGEQSGLDAIALLQQHYQPQHLIMLTGYASIATTVEAMRRGATDYLAKPVALPPRRWACTVVPYNVNCKSEPRRKQ